MICKLQIHGKYITLLQPLSFPWCSSLINCLLSWIHSRYQKKDQLTALNNSRQDMANKCSKRKKQFTFTKAPYLTQHVIPTLSTHGNSYANINKLTRPRNMRNISISFLKILKCFPKIVLKYRTTRSLVFPGL